MTNIYHLSHTDLRIDWRIRKEMSIVYKLFGNSNFRIIGVGINDGEIYKKNFVEGFKIINICIETPSVAKVHKVFAYIWNLSIYYKNVLRLFKSNSPRIVHIHDAPALPVAYLAKYIWGCSLIYDAHELAVNKNGQGIIFSLISRVIEKTCWSRIDHLVTVSKEIADWYISEYGRKNVTLHHNVPITQSQIININRNDNAFIPYRLKFDIPDTNKVFVYSGLFIQGRCIELILEVFKRIPEAHVVFMGFGNLTNLIDEYSLRFPNIHRHHHVPNEEVSKYISGADFGLCLLENISLSDYLALPNKFFEYLFNNVPVLASNFPAMARVINVCKGGYVCNVDNENITAAVKKLISLVGHNGVDIVAIHEYSWITQEKDLIKMYQELIIKNNKNL